MADAATPLDSLFSNINFSNPIGLGVSIILDTVISGIMILIIVEIFAKKYKEGVKPSHAFIVSLVITIINILGIVPLLGGMLTTLPFAAILVMVLPIIVWIVVVKLSFKELKISHVAIISVVCYLLSIYVIPMVMGMVAGMIPV